MTAEHILDAMNGLPDHLLEQTDKLRNQKKIHWKPWVAVACLVLAVGVTYSFLIAPAGKASDNAAEVGAALMDQVKQDGQTGQTGNWWIATVTAVEQDLLTVRMESGQEMKVELTRLQEKPEFMPGQRIRIYLEEAELLTDTPLKPYKIVIEEE